MKLIFSLNLAYKDCISGYARAWLRSLRLWCGHFCNVDSRYRIPTGVGISITQSMTITNPETNSHTTLAMTQTMALNVTHTMNIFCTFAFPNVNKSVDCLWLVALDAIESEIPTFAASVAVLDPKSSVPIHVKCCIIRSLFEDALLDFI